MPLKDLFTKAPSPLPPSEEPWPRPEAASSCSRDNIRQSSLHSATARPTLDEFLRTNYLMIPNFLQQVNNAKIAARTGKSVHEVQNTAAGHSMENLAVDQGLAVPSASINVSSSINLVKSNEKETKMVESRGLKEKDPKTAPVVHDTKSNDNLLATCTFSKSREIEVPFPLKPKPRVKKVMKGGTLVTIPAPQPRNRARQRPTEGGSKSTVPSVELINSESRENTVAVSEMRVEDMDIDKSCDSQQPADEDHSTIPCQDKSDSIIQQDTNSDSQELEEGLFTEECEQPQVPSIFCNTDVHVHVSQKSKTNTTVKNISDSLSEPNSDAIASSETKADKGIVFQGKDPEMNKVPKKSKMSTKTNDCLSNHLSDPSTSSETKADKRIVFQNKDPETNKVSESVSKEYDLGESINDPKIDPSGKAPVEKKSELIHDHDEPKLNDNLGEAIHKDYVETPRIAEPEEMEISKVSPAETEKELGSQVTVDVATYSSKNEKLPDLSNDLSKKRFPGPVKQSYFKDNENQVCDEPSKGINSKSKTEEKCITDKNGNHFETTDDAYQEVINRGVELMSHSDNANDLKNGNMEGCDVDVDDVNDDDDGNSNREKLGHNDDGRGKDGKEYEKEEREVEEKIDDEDEDEDDSNSDDDDDDDKDGDISTKGNTADDSSEEYAELVMDDSTSEEEEEYDFCPVNENDSDEEDDEESDYEVEDMNLDSDTESSTGGITLVQDTTIGKRVKLSRNKQREKRKAKNKRKKEAKKKAKAAKQAAKSKKKSHDSATRKTSLNDRQKRDPASKKKVAEKESNKRGSTSGYKPVETVSQPKPAAKTPPQNNPPQKNTPKEGSLLSMVSSCAMDPTVAASENLFAARKPRGGKQSKKARKREKRKAEAIERIRRGEPPPRTRRTFVELPTPVCSFYKEGKCRKGSDCSFIHDRSALIKKKEICKFYLTGSCFSGEDCIFMHSSFPCKFFHTSRCWEGDRCRFSHDALTEETERLLQACLNPPIENPVQSPHYQNPTGTNQHTADGSTHGAEVNLQTPTSSSPYNLRASTRKRALSTDGTGTESGSMIGGKISRRESQGKEEEDDSIKNNGNLRGAFLPGLYRDLSS